MKYLQQAVDFFLFTCTLTACCAVGLCMATEKLIVSELPPVVDPLHLLVFGSTLLVYNVHILVKKDYPVDVPVEQYKYRRWRSGFMALVGVACAASGIHVLTAGMLIGCGVLAVLSFGYSLPVLPVKEKRRIRDYGWMKILLLTGVWTVVTSVLPMLYLNKSPLNFPFEVLLRFAFIFTLCIIFDLRDVRKDAADKISTLPNAIGLHNSYRLIDASIILFVSLSVVQYLRYPIWERFAGALLTAVFTHFVAKYLRRNPSERNYLLIGDGLMLVYSGFIFLLP